jgi:hypothetical protein
VFHNKEEVVNMEELHELGQIENGNFYKIFMRRAQRVCGIRAATPTPSNNDPNYDN